MEKDSFPIYTTNDWLIVFQMSAIKNFPYFLILLVFFSSCHSNEQPEEIVAEVKPSIAHAGHSGWNYLSKGTIDSFVRSVQELPPLRNLGSPFDGLVFNKAIAYDYDGSKGEPALYIVENELLAPTIIRQHALNEREATQILRLFSNPSSYGGAPAFCFDPHLGIVLYYNDSIVAHISICVSCLRLRSSPPIAATSLKKIEIDESYTYDAEGFSESTIDKINKFCHQWSFRHFPK